MRFVLRSARRPFALAFSCWVMAMPLTSFARDAVLCRHRGMHQHMAPGDPSSAPCWCNDMTGSAPIITAETPSLPADVIQVPAGPLSERALTPPLTGSLPASPSYAPTPPPPNARTG